MYLTREQATAELVKTGSSEESAGKLLDSALRAYPQCHRTNFDMITGYPARVWNPPYSAVDRFTIAPWWTVQARDTPAHTGGRVSSPHGTKPSR